MAFRRRNKSYPFFSQEFLIQNHADIVFSLVIFILIGLMFEVRWTLILSFLPSSLFVSQLFKECRSVCVPALMCELKISVSVDYVQSASEVRSHRPIRTRILPSFMYFFFFFTTFVASKCCFSGRRHTRIKTALDKCWTKLQGTLWNLVFKVKYYIFAFSIKYL